MKPAIVLLLVLTIVFVPAPSFAVTASDIFDATQVNGGLIVHIGCGDGGKLTAALGSGNRNVVIGLDTDTGNIDKTRNYIKSRGDYGRVSAVRFAGKSLPFIDNLVNLAVVDDAFGISCNELVRVMAPYGVIAAGKGVIDLDRPELKIVNSGRLNGWTIAVKRWPADIDEWPQYLHGADNNAVAHDTVAGPPRHLQWVNDPEWSRSHMTIPTVDSIVSAGGRLFSIEDHATVEEPFLPGEFALVARNAFNGITLWSRPFAQWEPVTRYIKDISVQLQRRLAATADTVFCTPGLAAPVTAFNASTGDVVKVYKGTEKTQEFAYDRGALYMVIGDRMNAAAYNIVKLLPSKGISLGGSDPLAPFDGTGFRGAYAPETPDIENPTCIIVAVDAATGRELWRTDAIQNYVGCTLAIKDRYAVYQTMSGMFCRDRTTGKKIWTVSKPIQTGDGTSPNTLVLSDTMVYAQEGSTLHAYSIKTGKEMWTAPVANNYEKSADIFLAAGALWTGGSKKPTSRDPLTGKQNLVITQKMTGPMSHDRCYRNFITDLYYINSKTGGADFVTLDGSTEFPNYWVRGTCGMGVLPCNGLLYAPPYSCQCSIGAMIQNFNVLYTEKGLTTSDQNIPVDRTARLEKGPAYGYLGKNTDGDWPTYRHDMTRGGTTSSVVPATHLKRLWQTRLKTAPSAPIVADGKVFVADIDAHTVYALDMTDGSVVWNYVAGARVDSPPTFYKGLVLFGSRDGWVHCLRASDGALAWRFRDLPDRLIGAFGQLESAWPVSGSILIMNDTAYFAAGRSSFLDGGIFLYGLDPRSGRLVYSRRVYGPFTAKTGFPATAPNGFKSDIMVSDGKRLYIRHKSFNPDLTDADSSGPHLIPSAGFLDRAPQHRTFWTVGTGYRASLGDRPSGDILVTKGKEFYEIRGFAVKRHSYFDPRVSGYKLFAGTLRESGVASARGRRGKKKGSAKVNLARSGRWSSNVPLTGKAMAMADDVIFVAGNPVAFPANDLSASYEGRLGGILWTASATDGHEIQEYKLDTSPAWDGMAAAKGRLFISLIGGGIECWGQQ